MTDQSPPIPTDDLDQRIDTITNTDTISTLVDSISTKKQSYLEEPGDARNGDNRRKQLHKISNSDYLAQIEPFHVELLKLQNWVKNKAD